MPADATGKPEYWLSHYVAYFLQIVEADRVAIRDLRVTWGETDLEDIVEITPEKMESYMLPMPVSNETHWPAVWAERVTELTMDNCDLEAFGGHSSTVQLDQVQKARIRDCSFSEDVVSVSKDCVDVKVQR